MEAVLCLVTDREPSADNPVRITGIDDVLLIVGGVIPTDHVARLEQMGVDAVFTPGGTMSDVVDYIRANVRGGQEAVAGDRR